ncbi:MAG: Asparagine synthetase [glutamine-hydrolyzing] 1 [Holosporales bacterium]
MCGITGFISKKDVSISLLEAMNDTIAYRGPDSSGLFFENYNGDRKIGLAHRRLSIIDLSPLGHQPMIFDNVVIVFNGEVYNFKKIRADLEKVGFSFKSNSDTEVILKAYLAYGIDFIDHLNGMFAIALYDKRTNDFYLIRDRLGVKPLYYSFNESELIFGSELKPLMMYPNFKKEIDLHALSLFLYHGYIVAPHTIFKNVYKLKPGSYLHFNDNKVKNIVYWSVAEKFKKRDIIEKSEEEWIDDLESLLINSVKDRMVSDVPIGAFLSGGIDSSLITALMQKNAHTPVKTFTIGFNEKEYNEATYAKDVAKHLKTEHHELYLPIQTAEELIPKIPHYYDEPFADSSQLPTMLLSEMTRKHVTVALSGDGGDELFCGYGRYDDVLRLSRLENYAKIAKKIPFFKSIIKNVTNNSKYTQFFELTNDHNVINSAYLNYIHHWPVIKNHTMQFDKAYEDIMSLSDKIQEKHMLQDMVTYLPDDILTKVDRASMAYSLEARAAMIDDHRVLEFSFSMPHDMKFKNGEKKYILKKILKRYIPGNLINRPKMGFGVPIYDWLRTDLKHLIDHFLSDDYIKKQDIFDLKEIQRIRSRFLNSENVFLKLKAFKSCKLYKDGMIDRIIWHILVFQMWHEHYC